jgi:hypothetical protein
MVECYIPCHDRSLLQAAASMSNYAAAAGITAAAVAVANMAA